MKRTTIRFNDQEEAELESFKRQHHLDNDSEAIKTAITFAHNYIKNVSELFFGSNYDVILQRKRKTKKADRLVF